jgi:hypothetical protein
MIALALHVAAAFNLVCTGTSGGGDTTGAFLWAPRVPFTTVFRIDLERGRWCAGDCATTRRLAGVSETVITLDSLRDRTSNEQHFLSTLNRENGRYFSSFRSGRSLFVQNAQCEVAPFGGFPEPRF